MRTITTFFLFVFFLLVESTFLLGSCYIAEYGPGWLTNLHDNVFQERVVVNYPLATLFVFATILNLLFLIHCLSVTWDETWKK